jgi:hypothetical protein
LCAAREFRGVNFPVWLHGEGLVMRFSVLGGVFALGLAFLAQGCAGIPYRTYDLVDDIAEDQQSLNDAYGRALNGQILLNVLRSRDRWPRHYTNVSAITDQPTIQSSGTATLGPLSLGSPARPFGESQLGFGHEQSTRPSYGVEPLDADAINRAVLSPTKRTVFAHYWSSGWPRDILLFVMVSGISRSTGSAPSAEAIGMAAQGGADWANPVRNSVAGMTSGCAFAAAPENPTSPMTTWPDDPSGANAPSNTEPSPAPRSDCAFFQLAHRLADLLPADIRVRAVDDPVCQESARVRLGRNNADLIASMAGASAVEGNELSMALSEEDRPPAPARGRPRPPAPVSRDLLLQACAENENPPVLLEVLGGPKPWTPTDTHPGRIVLATYYLELRSLDSMVYSMGELIRGTSDGNVDVVRGPCGPANCPKTPLFRVTRGPVDRDEDYSAVVVHRSQRYLAGPAVEVMAGADPASGDRTATVLTLLTQIFALNNSTAPVAAIPARPVID